MRVRRVFISAGLALLALTGGAARSWAADSSKSPSQRDQPAEQPRPDFLFGQPRAWIGLGGSLVVPRGSGDLFTFVQKQLTIDKRDFRAPALNVQGGWTLAPRMETAFGVEVGQSNTASEYRDFVDNDRLPITQKTAFQQINISAGLKIALTPRGRPISRYAFIPRTVIPYVEGGAGAMYYKFEQQGEFVDFQTFRIFNDNFVSEGWTPSGHFGGGADFRIWRSVFLNADARYVWAHAQLDQDFIGFNGIDLNGFRMTTGFTVAIR